MNWEVNFTFFDFHSVEGYQMCRGCHENRSKINTVSEFLVNLLNFCIFSQGKYSLDHYDVKGKVV